ncbi:MAG TPA: nuclear transport factor 2 family protein [Candidatus Dormibacteraeota bacterium]|jgi:Flp pilus assembly protein TadG
MLPIPRPRPRRWALALATVAASTCLSGCGASDSDKIKDSVRNYIQAVLDDNGTAACGLLTPDAAKVFVDRVKAQTKTSDCATAFKQEAATLKDDEKAIYRSAVLSGVTVSGDTATVTVKFTGVNKDIRLKKVNGDWRIDTGPAG